MKKGSGIRPPKLAERLLMWYCRNAQIEDIQGDLEELFTFHKSQKSVARARAWYWKNVLTLIFSYAIKRRKQKGAYHTLSLTVFHPAMLKNYFLIATRNLVRHKFFTVINLLGLAIGM